MNLSQKPLKEFDIMNYGMVTNLEGLTTGSTDKPGWSPESEKKPDNSSFFSGSTLWTYGGGGCFPEGCPVDESDVSRIVNATLVNGWDGVDFDDEGNMNIPLVIETMTQLKQHSKQTSFGFIAGSVYNSPESAHGSQLNAKVAKIIKSGKCDRLIHYCYSNKMWSDNDIVNNVHAALERSLSLGLEPQKIILALTARGLTDWNLEYFISEVQKLELGGLFAWLYNELSHSNIEKIKVALS